MLPQPLENLINRISDLPGIGRRQAARLAFFLLNQPVKELRGLAEAVTGIKSIKTCSRCFNFTEEDLCVYCRNKNRDQQIICAVEDAMDIATIEKTGQYKGVYHVLGGLISPLDKITPDKLKIKELFSRLKKEPVKELIMALNPTTEGDATILYIERLLKEAPIKITRLARGLSTGSDLEYADDSTMINALLGRK